MNINQFDAHNKKSITVNVVGPSYAQRIEGEGYFIIVSGGKYVSFSKTRHDVCFGDVVPDIIKEYTAQQYVDDFGDRLTGTGKTVREYLQQNCRMEVN